MQSRNNMITTSTWESLHHLPCLQHVTEETFHKLWKCNIDNRARAMVINLKSTSRCMDDVLSYIDCPNDCHMLKQVLFSDSLFLGNSIVRFPMLMQVKLTGHCTCLMS
jgi:hypothetical protein